MGGARPKQFIEILGRPLLAHTLLKFERSAVVDEIVVVLPRDGFLGYRALMAPWSGGPKVRAVVPGGLERQDSVWEGFAALPDDFDGVVMVHDGARPLVSDEIVRTSAEQADLHGAAIVGLPVHETLKEIEGGRLVRRTIDRECFVRAQTPQAFRAAVLKDALERARADGFLGTDESALVERLNIDVYLVPGSERNIKVTTPEDLALAAHYLGLEAPE